MDWKELRSGARTYLEARQARLQTQFGLGDWPRFDYDLERAEIYLSRDGVPRACDQRRAEVHRAALETEGSLVVLSASVPPTMQTNGIAREARNSRFFVHLSRTRDPTHAI